MQLFKPFHAWIIVIACLSLFHPAHAQKPAPTVNGQPVEVQIKILINEIVDISTVDETFDLDGYLTLVWKDSAALDLYPELTTGTKVIYHEDAVANIVGQELWFPNLEFMNSAEPREIASRRIELTGDQVLYTERFQAKILSNTNLTAFPFDTQVFSLEIESFGFNGDQMTLVPMEREADISENIKNDAWSFTKSESRSYEYAYPSPIGSDFGRTVYFSRFEFSIPATRRIGYFIWQFFLPLFILIVATWFIPTLWKAGFAQELVFTMLLTSVMFSFYTSSFLPQLSYNTFLEAIVIVSNGIVFLTLVLVLIRREKSGRFQWIHNGWTVPIISILAYAFTIWLFFEDTLFIG